MYLQNLRYLQSYELYTVDGRNPTNPTVAMAIFICARVYSIGDGHPTLSRESLQWIHKPRRNWVDELTLYTLPIPIYTFRQYNGFEKVTNIGGTPHFSPIDMIEEGYALRSK